MNIPLSPSQLSSSTTGVPVMVLPSNFSPFGSPSMVVCISASLSRLVTVAGLIGIRSVHLGLPGSSRTVSITLLSTSTSGRFGSLSSTGFLTSIITIALPFFFTPSTENSRTAFAFPFLLRSGFCFMLTFTEPSAGMLLNRAL